MLSAVLGLALLVPSVLALGAVVALLVAVELQVRLARTLARRPSTSGRRRVAFDVLGLDEVVAITLPYNVGSPGVMTAAGLAYERDIVHAGLPHVLYRKRRP